MTCVLDPHDEPEPADSLAAVAGSLATSTIACTRSPAAAAAADDAYD
jgi:hypothetical protein